MINFLEGLLSTFRSQLGGFLILYLPAFLSHLKLLFFFFPFICKGGLSSDILALQHQSSQLGLRLTNRQSVKALSGQIIDDLIIPESLIR